MAEQGVFLSMVPAGARERRVALALALLSLAALLALAPFARVQLPRVDAFIPIYHSVLAISDLVTAALLFGQFVNLRMRGVLLLASAYLFATFMVVAHTASFPGLFGPGGLIGGPQTPVWIYMLWHAGFPLLVGAYAIVDRIERRRRVTVRSPGAAVLVVIGAVAGTVALLVVLATVGEPILPAIIAGDRFTPSMIGVVSGVWALTFAALALLWARRPHSVLDVWLMVVMCVWLGDMALSAMLNAGRFDLGFYSGRVFGLLAGGIVLAVLLLQTSRLQAAFARKLEAERTEALGMARHSRDLLAATIDAAPYAIVSLDRGGNIVLWNAAAERIFGYMTGEILGRPYALLVPPNEAAAHESHFQMVAAGGRPQSVITTRRRKDGTDVSVRLSGSRVVDAAGAFTSAVFTLEDVTHELTIEEQLRQAQKMEAIGNLTGGVAHDFNNMLAVVVGNLEYLELKLPSDGAPAEAAKEALDAALSGAELVQRLLAFSRRQALNPASLDVKGTIEDIAVLMQRTLGETIRVDLSLDEDVGRIMADKNQLENALLNLAINARDAMPKGGRITIAARGAIVDADNAPIYPDLTPGAYVALSVTDTGLGIAPDVLPRIFEPFFTTKGEGRGTGLGLAMVYGFLRQSGGTAKVYSEVGHGTTVRLYFPRADTQDGAEADGEAPAAEAVTGTERILVVEDRDDLRRVSANTLQRLGYATIECSDADQALAVLLSGEKIDLVFTDIVMPGTMSGLDLSREIRRRSLPVGVLLTSGYASPEILRNQAQHLGYLIVSKPYRTVELSRQIRSALEMRPRAGAPSA